MKYRVSQAASIIPIAGYAILWNREVGTLFDLQDRIRDGAWFTISNRLYLIYFGSVFLTAALILFWWRCPKFIRRHPDVEDYVLEQGHVASASDIRRFRKITKAMVASADGKKMDYTEKAGTLIRENMKPSALNEVSGQFPEQKRGSFKAYYLQHDENRMISIIATFIFIWFGITLFLLPSVEVFYLVVRSLMFLPLPVT
jgi:hypothetical protein